MMRRRQSRLPFSFRYYGQPFSSVTVSSNGFLVFGTGAATAWVNCPAPEHRRPQRHHRRLLGRPQPSPRRQHLAPHPRHHPQPQTRHQLARHPPRRHRRPDQLPGRARRRKQRDPARLPGHAAREHQPRPRRLRHGRPRITRRHNRQPIPPQPTPPRPLPSHHRTPLHKPAARAGGHAGAGRSQRSDRDRRRAAASRSPGARTAEPDLAGYRLYKQATDGSWALLATTITAGYTQTGLPAGSPASYRVTAFDRATPANESAPSATASATPLPDLTPPSAPSGLQAAAGDRQVTLDWADNTDAVAGYRVYRNGSPVATPTGSGYTDTGLTNGSTYTYRVTALDQAGNESAPSNQVSASPQAPGHPTRRNQLPPAAGAVCLGGCDRRRNAVAPWRTMRRRPSRLPFSFRYYGQPFIERHRVLQRLPRLRHQRGDRLDQQPRSPTPPPPTASSPPTGTTSTQPSAAASGTAPSAPPPTANSSSAGSASATPTPPARSASRPCSKKAATRSCSPTRTRCTGTPAHDHGNSATIGIESPDGTIGSQFLHNQPLLGPLQATTALRYTNRAAGPPPPPDVTPPAVPTGLPATAGDRQVTLDWADNTDARRRLPRLPKRQPGRDTHRQRLHRHRPHERQHATPTGSLPSTRPATKAPPPTRSAPAHRPRSPHPTKPATACCRSRSPGWMRRPAAPASRSATTPQATVGLPFSVPLLRAAVHRA